MRKLIRRGKTPEKRPQQATRPPATQSRLFLKPHHPRTYLFDDHPLTPRWFGPAKQPKVSIIIPINKKTKSVQTWDLEPEVELVYVDDGSENYRKAIQEWRQKKDQIAPFGKLIVNTREPQGWFASCITGIKHASAENLVFLNAAVSPNNNWLRPLIRTLKKDHIGIVSPLIEHEDGSFEAGFEWSWNKWDFLSIGQEVYHGTLLSNPFVSSNSPRDLFKLSSCDSVNFSCFAIRKSTFYKTTLSVRDDPQWFVHDLCMSLKEKGYEIATQGNSKVLGSQKSDSKNARSTFYHKWTTPSRIDKIHPRDGKGRPIKSILVRKVGSHSEVSLASSIVFALKKKFRDCKIAVDTNHPEIFESDPCVDQIVKIEEASERQFHLYINLDLSHEYNSYMSALEIYADIADVDPKEL